VRKCFKKNIKVNRAKQALKNKEARFLTKQILKDEIEKKNINRKKTTTKLFTLQQLQRV
jgi:hypothetical protein